MKLRQKSQVTMLMIIGIVMFIIAGLVLYLAKSSVKKTVRGSLKITQETALESQQIKEFVTQCLDKTAKDAVVLLGKQGGYIYKSQGGTLKDFDARDEGFAFIKYNRNNVVYDIRMPLLYSPPPYSLFIPIYPWQIFPFATLDSNEKKFEGIFGINNIPHLTPSTGSHSIETQIQKFIDNNILKCLDFSVFEAQDYDINLDTAKAKSDVIIGSKDVNVKLAMPVKAVNKVTLETFEFNEYSTILNIRLKDIYFFTKELIQNDIVKINFDLRDPSNNKNSFYIKLIENVYNKDDAIIVKDEKSLVYSQPYEFVFARENRAPALYYIKNDIIEFPEDYIIHQNDLLQGSELKAEDPDEDSITIDVKALLPNPDLPTIMDRQQIQFRIEANDGALSDYQIITAVKRNE